MEVSETRATEVAEAVLGRRPAGQRCLEGHFGEEIVTPVAKWKAAFHIRGALMSEGLACDCLITID